MRFGVKVAMVSCAILLWIALDTVWWYSATRDDYAAIAVARACDAMSAEARAADPQCANVLPADAKTRMDAINRTTAKSRALGALGGVALIALVILLRRRPQTG